MLLLLLQHHNLLVTSGILGVRVLGTVAVNDNPLGLALGYQRSTEEVD